VSLIAAAALGAFAWAIFLATPAQSLPEDRADVRFEYHTTEIPAASLQARLEELGRAGWDVFSIERGGSTIEQTADNKTRLVADSFQVTARRRGK
jgi:hypothetical protein